MFIGFSSPQTTSSSDLIIYFALISGRAESFGIPLVANRLYSVNFGSRFIAQTFHGCELCFMTQNPDATFDIRAKFITPPAYRPKNLPPDAPTPVQSTEKKFEFVSFPQNGFTKFNAKTEALSTSELASLIRLNSRNTPNVHQQKPASQADNFSGMTEHLYLNCTVKQFGKYGPQRPPNWTYQSYAQFAQELNQKRMDASKRNQQGPNIIIVGPCDSGKSTFAKIITNYAVNGHWSPFLVDLDVGQGAIGVPGIIGAGVVDNYCHLDKEYTFRSGYPLMVHYGANTPDSEKAVHLLSVNCLARQIGHSLRSEEEQADSRFPSTSSSKLPPNLNQITLAEKLSSSKRSQELRSTSPMQSNVSKQRKRQLTKWSGLVINTHGWIFDYGYDCTMDAIRKFGVSAVLVLGDYRFYERIHKDLLGYDVPRGPARPNWNPTPASNAIKVHFFQRNFSAFKRNSNQRRHLRSLRCSRFFSSPSLQKLSQIAIPFAHHPIFRFYSEDSFSRFLKESSNSESCVQPHNYWIRKVEKTGRDRRGPNFDQVVFHHLNRESLVYLMNRILSILELSIEQLLNHDNNWLSLRHILLVKGFARISQIDLEKECLQVEVPELLVPAVANGKLVLLVTDNVYDPEEPIY